MKVSFLKYYSILFFWVMCFFSFAQTQEKRNFKFSKPVNLPFNLAGSFGEPRKDHFHSGIDIKTNGMEGEPVFAVYDGYISRIRVSPYGYGRAIYITHTNGFTSVYGHLNKFYGAIENYIHKQHYQSQKSELDLTLNASVFPLKQNDTIAFSGNTGGSSAPHLHFEIRNTKTEHALNPLDFYPRDFYVDTIPPQLNKVKVYQFGNTFYNNNSAVFEFTKKEHFLTTNRSILIEAKSNFCFSFEGFDKQDTSENKNGIKKIEVFQKDSMVFKYDLTEIDFDKTRMCNAFVDYNEMMNDSGYFYNCYQINGNTLPIYSSINNTFFKINNDDTIDLSVFCYDYNSNKTEIKLNFVSYTEDIDTIMVSMKSINSKYIKADKIDSMVYEKIKLLFAANTFYEDLAIRYNISKQQQSISDSFYFFLSKSLTPLQKSVKIELASSIKKDRNKIVVVRQDNKGKETALKTTFDKTKFHAETKELGLFYLKYDTTSPVIDILNLIPIAIGTEIPNLAIQVKISDNLSGIDSYNSYIDGKWVNFYYDAKNDVIQYNLDEYCTKGEHTLKIVVTDKVGNKMAVLQKFTY